jgi:hypothetical protein
MAGAIAGLVAAQTESGGIPWDADRPLVWSDFRGPIDPAAPADVAALTSASISMGYGVAMRRDRRCRFEITQVEVDAIFHPEQSWARDRARTPLVLEHEQGHFDLTHVFRMMLQRDAGALVGEARACPAGADMPAIESRAADLIGRVRDRNWDELARVQAQYDAETGHGTLPQVQREWTARIQRALSRGRW